MIQRKRSRLSLAEKQDIWRRWKCVQSMHAIGRAYGRPHPTIRKLLLPSGGIPTVARRRSRLALTLAEREDISRKIASGFVDSRDLSCQLPVCPQTGNLGTGSNFTDSGVSQALLHRI